MSGLPIPRLRARTIRLDAGIAPPLERFADPRAPLVWLRRGEGIVGSGPIRWRGEFGGAARVLDAADAWRELVASAEIEDAAGVPGSGLAAFGAFAFAAGSAQASVLEVPATIVGLREGVAFVTAITADGSDPEPALPEAAAAGPDPRTAFRDGAMTADRHRRAVDHAIDLINEGALSKLVIARDLAGRLPEDADLRHLVGRLAVAYPACWTYAVDGLVGASPEMLVRVLGRGVAARVLAGTAPRGDSPESDAAAARALRASAKNRAEHAFAVDSALASLRELDAHDDPERGLTASPEPFLLELPNVWHLASDVRGTLPKGRTVLELVAALHPTAAVGGTPREAAIDAIARLEPFDRRRYAGPVGWLSASGDGEWAIALRGAEIGPDGGVTAYAGGGIVATSDPADEFSETEWKLRPLLETLGLPGAAAQWRSGAASE